MAASTVTCVGRKGSTIDYLVVSQGLSTFVQDVVRWIPRFQARDVDVTCFTLGTRSVGTSEAQHLSH